MAKNYKAYEAAEIVINPNKENAQEYHDIFKRMPLFGAQVLKLNEAGIELLRVLPENVTARKINKNLKVAYGILDEEEEAVEPDVEGEEVEEAPKPKKNRKAKKAREEEPEEDELEAEAEEAEEDEEEPKPKKKERKSKKDRKSKKAKVVEEAPEEEDDDFDFDDEE